MIDLLEPFWNLLFPPHCPLCHAYVSRRGEWCEVCLSLACMPHRIPLSSSMREVIDPVWALGLYRDRLRPLIYRLKYRKQKAVLPYLTTLLRQAMQHEEIRSLIRAAEIAVPVPLHAGREKLRGFNQSELIFGSWLQESGLPVERLLKRCRATVPMYRLTAAQRQVNLSGAFSVTSGAGVYGRRILLLDDIMTTGATLSACAETLRRAGAAEVSAIVLASDRH